MTSHEVETQTDLHCSPHFVPRGDLARVQQESECQTAISAMPSLSITQLLPELKHLSPSLLACDSVHQISKIKLQWLEPTPEEPEPLEIKHPISDDRLLGRKSSIKKTSTVEMIRCTISNAVDIACDMLSPSTLEEIVEESDEASLEIMSELMDRAHVETQTDVIVRPFLVVPGNRANVISEASTQTGVCAEPDSSIGVIYPQLQRKSVEELEFDRVITVLSPVERFALQMIHYCLYTSALPEFREIMRAEQAAKLRILHQDDDDWCGFDVCECSSISDADVCDCISPSIADSCECESPPVIRKDTGIDECDCISPYIGDSCECVSPLLIERENDLEECDCISPIAGDSCECISPPITIKESQYITDDDKPIDNTQANKNSMVDQKDSGDHLESRQTLVRIPCPFTRNSTPAPETARPLSYGPYFTAPPNRLVAPTYYNDNLRKTVGRLNRLMSRLIVQVAAGDESLANNSDSITAISMMINNMSGRSLSGTQVCSYRPGSSTSRNISGHSGARGTMQELIRHANAASQQVGRTQPMSLRNLEMLQVQEFSYTTTTPESKRKYEGVRECCHLSGGQDLQETQGEGVQTDLSLEKLISSGSIRSSNYKENDINSQAVHEGSSFMGAVKDILMMSDISIPPTGSFLILPNRKNNRCAVERRMKSNNVESKIEGNEAQVNICKNLWKENSISSNINPTLVASSEDTQNIQGVAITMNLECEHPVSTVNDDIKDVKTSRKVTINVNYEHKVYQDKKGELMYQLYKRNNTSKSDDIVNTFTSGNRPTNSNISAIHNSVASVPATDNINVHGVNGSDNLDSTSLPCPSFSFDTSERDKKTSESFHSYSDSTQILETILMHSIPYVTESEKQMKDLEDLSKIKARLRDLSKPCETIELKNQPVYKQRLPHHPAKVEISLGKYDADNASEVLMKETPTTGMMELVLPSVASKSAFRKRESVTRVCYCTTQQYECTDPVLRARLCFEESMKPLHETLDGLHKKVRALRIDDLKSCMHRANLWNFYMHKNKPACSDMEYNHIDFNKFTPVQKHSDFCRMKDTSSLMSMTHVKSFEPIEPKLAYHDVFKNVRYQTMDDTRTRTLRRESYMSLFSTNSNTCCGSSASASRIYQALQTALTTSKHEISGSRNRTRREGQTLKKLFNDKVDHPVSVITRTSQSTLKDRGFSKTSQQRSKQATRDWAPSAFTTSSSIIDSGSADHSATSPSSRMTKIRWLDNLPRRGEPIFSDPEDQWHTANADKRNPKLYSATIKTASK